MIQYNKQDLIDLFHNSHKVPKHSIIVEPFQHGMNVNISVNTELFEVSERIYYFATIDGEACYFNIYSNDGFRAVSNINEIERKMFLFDRILLKPATQCFFMWGYKITLNI